jgi:hypothetical protein
MMNELLSFQKKKGKRHEERERVIVLLLPNLKGLVVWFQGTCSAATALKQVLWLRNLTFP